MASPSAPSTDLRDYHKVLRKKLRRMKIPQHAVKDLGVELGHGAFAKVRMLEVYGMRCAGKRLHDILFKDASQEIATRLVDNFAEECIRLSELRHPNIVQLIGVTFDEKSLTLVMEYLPMSLTDFLEGYESIPDFTKASILLDVGYALLFLHQQEPPIVHRDLSTNNVLLTRELQAKISDLGVAKRLQGGSGLAELMSLCPGTQSYMPPEAKTASLRNSDKAEYNVKLDCFSFGNIVIQVIVQTSLEFLLDADPLDPSRPLKDEVKRRSLYLREMTDHMLYDLTVKCLQDNPADRPTSAEIVKKVKAFKDDNPPPFQNAVEMWTAFVDSGNRLRSLQSELTDLKSPKFEDHNATPGSYEKLRSRVRVLENELTDKDEVILKKENEIAGYKSSIVSLKVMLGAATSQEHENGELLLSGSPKRQQPVLPSPVPPSREKKKQPPPKPPRPWAFSMSSSPPLSPPPSPPEGSPPSIPKPRSRASTDSSSSSPIVQQHRQGMDDIIVCYSELPGFPDPYAEIEHRVTPAQIRSQPTTNDDTIEITSPVHGQPRPRPRASTHSSNFLPTRPPRNRAPLPHNESHPVGTPLPPQKPARKGKALPISTPTDEYDKQIGAGRPRKSSAPESSLGKHRNKPLPPIPKSQVKGLQAATDEAGHYEREDTARIYEIPLAVTSRDKQQAPPEHYEEITGVHASIYEVMEPVSAKSGPKPPKQVKPDRPPPPPKPSPGGGASPRKRSNPGVPKVAMLPHTGNQDSQFQKLLARQQQKIEGGAAGGRFQELEKQRSQPQISSEGAEVDPTLKRKLAKQKEKLQPKHSH